MEPVFLPCPYAITIAISCAETEKYFLLFKKVDTTNKLITIYLYFCHIMLNFVFFHAHRTTLETEKKPSRAM